MTYAVSTVDIESRWRSLSDTESDVATVLIDDAVALIDTYRPNLAAAVAAGTVPERIVVMTVVEAVIRVLSNPDILANQSVTADGGISIGWQFQRETPAPRMRLSLLDFAAIDQALSVAGLSSGVVGSMRMINSTSWSKSAAYRGGPLDVDDVEASDLQPNASLTDSVTIHTS